MSMVSDWIGCGLITRLVASITRNTVMVSKNEMLNSVPIISARCHPYVRRPWMPRLLMRREIIDITNPSMSEAR